LEDGCWRPGRLPGGCGRRRGRTLWAAGVGGGGEGGCWRRVPSSALRRVAPQAAARATAAERAPVAGARVDSWLVGAACR